MDEDKSNTFDVEMCTNEIKAYGDRINEEKNVEIEKCIESSQGKINKRRIRRKTEKAQEYVQELEGRKRRNDEEKKEYKKKINDPLYCICKKPDDGKIMVQCNWCKQWFHGKCIGILSNEDSEKIGEYLCGECMQETQIIMMKMKLMKTF